MSKFPSMPGKGPKKIGTPVSTKASPAEGASQMKSGQMLQKMLASNPPSAKKQPVQTPSGGFKPGMSGQQYEGAALKDYSAMRPKLATKDKILNPVKKAVGMGHLAKGPKLVPKK